MLAVYLFNSTTDLALAADCAPFRPAARLRALENDLASLPALCGGQDGAPRLCLTFDALDLAAHRRGRTTALCLRKGGTGEKPESEAVEIDLRRCVLRPWGWNRDIRLRALRGGLPELLPPEEEIDPSLTCGFDQPNGRWRLIPSESQLAAWRQLAHRAAWLDLPLPATPYLHLIRKTKAGTAGDIARFLGESGSGAGVVLKRPYSCSGRGLLQMPALLPPTPQAARWIADGLRRQGSLVVEERMGKVQDLAALFRASYEPMPDGSLHYTVRHTGFSLFRTDTNGAYRGNLLLGDSLIAKRVEGESGFPPGLLRETANALGQALRARLEPAGYCGCIGVDQLVARTAEGFRLCPVVEVNLRHTMGFVAHALGRQRAALARPACGEADGGDMFFALEARKDAATPWPSSQAYPLLPTHPQALFRAVVYRT